jgi:hypothetical protein
VMMECIGEQVRGVERVSWSHRHCESRHREKRGHKEAAGVKE